MPNFTANGNLQMIRFFGAGKSFVRTGVGNNQHFFYNSKNPYEVKNNDDEFFAYAFLDPQNPPKQVMLQFNDGNWEHRAYWGESLIPYGREGTVTKVKMGPLPELGIWIRLSVKAKKVGLETNAKVNGIAFQWMERFTDKIGVLSKLIPDRTLSFHQKVDIDCQNDKSLPGNIQNLSKKSEKDHKDNEKEILKFHSIISMRKHLRHKQLTRKSLDLSEQITKLTPM